MKNRMCALLLGLASLVASACGGGAEAPGGSGDRLPHVLAPMDTEGVAGGGAASDTSRGPALDADSLDARWSADPPFPWLPRPKDLVYSQYRNDAFGYVIAYPDTVFKPRADIGVNRGREFHNADSTAVVLVYAEENAGLPLLDDHYQDYLGEPGLRITYQVREEDWYVVSGYRGGRKFYDKTVLRGGTLKTFQIQYDTTHAAYYDAITATMAASFKG